MSQEYLAYVAEGRIAPRGAVESIEGRTVRFADGAETDVDAVICATGYDLDLPYLSPDIRRALGDDRNASDLYLRTFHPDLPGLALLGQFLLIGPQIPTVELQARWVAAVWSGALAAPATERMQAGIAEHRATRGAMPFDMYPALAATLAAELGVEPDVDKYPELAQGLLFGPLAPARWLLDGPGRASRGRAAAGRGVRRARSAAARSGGPDRDAAADRRCAGRSGAGRPPIGWRRG